MIPPQVERMTWEVDTEPYARQRDVRVAQQAIERGIEVTTCTSHTLFEPERVIAKNKGEVPLTYQKHCSLLSSLGPPPKPIPAPAQLPAGCR